MLLLIFFCTQLLADESIGHFSVESGDGKKLSSINLSGMITVLFYESKDNIEVNRPAKEQLNRLYYSLNELERKHILRLPVIDCTEASRLFHGIWNKQLVKNSEIEEVDVYGDWEGGLKEALSLNSNGSYLIIFDQSGRICFWEEGQVSEDKIIMAEEILQRLLNSDY